MSKYKQKDLERARAIPGRRLKSTNERIAQLIADERERAAQLLESIGMDRAAAELRIRGGQ